MAAQAPIEDLIRLQTGERDDGGLAFGLGVSFAGAYRYDGSFRLNDYINPGLTPASLEGLHQLDTRYLLQNHDLVLLPQAKFRFLLGYTRGLQTGPGISTMQIFDSRGDLFPLFCDVRRLRNEYRVGSEIDLFGVKLTWTRGWDDFREDTPFASGWSPGIGSSANTTVTSFQRAEPYHGSSPFWRAGFSAGNNAANVSGYFTTTSGERAFVLDESVRGTGASGMPITRQALAFGNARRPIVTGNLNINLWLTPKLSLTASGAFYDTRIDGHAALSEFVNAGIDASMIGFQLLRIRTIAGDATLNYQLSPRFGIAAGYHYSTRAVHSIEQTDAGFYTDMYEARQTNNLHAGTLQLRLQFTPELSATLDGEIGRADHPIYPTSDGSYNVAGGRLQYRRRKLTLWAASRANYNNNSVQFSVYSSQNRTQQAHASWSPGSWLTIDADYSNIHLRTVGGLAYFASGRFEQGGRSYYFSNIHAANFGAKLHLHKADLYLGYSRIQDTGDGRATPFSTTLGPDLPAFQLAQTFPLVYQSPLMRLSIPIQPKLRWNIGYQYYGLREDFFRSEGFRANTGYSSLLWSF